MKFIWQQVCGFLVVILITVGIMAYQTQSYMKDRIFTEHVNQLVNYGTNIVNNDFSRAQLSSASQLLASDEIMIQVYLSDGRTIFPTYDQRLDSNLSKDDLALINSGHMLSAREIDRLGPDGKPIPYLIVYMPHHDVAQFPKGFISLGKPLSDIEEQWIAMRRKTMISFLLASMIGIFISVIYAYFQTRKINRLQVATREISSGKYDVVLDFEGKDEFGDLARDFNKMAYSLKESEEEIDRQETLRRQFMMDVAHEMRTPLTTMSGVIEGLKYDMIPENQKQRSLDLVYKETQRLTRLVNENLDYEKIRSHQLVLHKQFNDGKKLLNQIKIQLDDKASVKGNKIIVEVSDNLKIWGDYDRLVQILINLVTNAIQFSQNGVIKLVGYEQEEWVILKVIDQGIGIDVEEIKNIWERFYKVDISRKSTEFGESGIGLSVVKSLVEAHNGIIQVESQIGKGSTFIVKLPNKDKKENVDGA